MKRILASNNIYYLFKSTPNNGKKIHYEDVFVPKFFLNLFKLSKKKKKLRSENKKYEEKDYLLNINSYFKPEQLDTINAYNNNNKQKFIPKSTYGKRNRLFSANIKALPKLKYTINDIISCNSKNNAKIDNYKYIKHNCTISEIYPKKTKKNDKDNNFIAIKNIRKIKINDNSKNNSIENSSRTKNYENNNIKSIIKSRNDIIPNQIEEKKLKFETTSLKSVSVLKAGRLENRKQLIDYTKSIISRKISFLRTPKADEKKKC
jgi:hypothetical protein